jgi:hypothetical protein
MYIKAVNHCFGDFLLKLAGNVYKCNGKHGIPLFCFIVKMNTNEDTVFALNDF